MTFGMLYKALHGQTFEYCDKILKYNHSNGVSSVLLYFGVIYYAVKGGSIERFRVFINSQGKPIE